MSSRIILVSFAVVAVIAAVFVLLGPLSARFDDSGAQLAAPATETLPATLAATAESPTAAATATAMSSPTSPLASPQPPATQPESPIAETPITPEPVYTFDVVAEYPHDPEAWTQGLVYTNSVLYLGTGLHGHSSLRKTDLESGEILQSVELSEEYFGEGVTVLDGKVYQLTWQEHQGFVYGEQDFAELMTFEYPTEGWGLTHDGKQLIMSDGTNYLYFRDPVTLEETGRVAVTSRFGPLRSLNELEYVNGEVYANVWLTDWIARIDPQTGHVLGWVDLRGLLGAEYRQDGKANVLNGIAYDEENDRLLVTGKFWPRIFEIELIPVE